MNTFFLMSNRVSELRKQRNQCFKSQCSLNNGAHELAMNLGETEQNFEVWKGSPVHILLPPIRCVLPPGERRNGQDYTAVLPTNPKKGYGGRSPPGLRSVYRSMKYIGEMSNFSFTGLFYRKNKWAANYTQQ